MNESIIVPTAMRAAFERIQVKRVVNRDSAQRIAAAIMDKLAGKAGLMKKNAINVDVSFRTFKQLQKEEVLV